MKNYQTVLYLIWTEIKGRIFLTHYSIIDSIYFNLFHRVKLARCLIYRNGFQVFPGFAPSRVIDYLLKKNMIGSKILPIDYSHKAENCAVRVRIMLRLNIR
jgi:hypothetical protein